MKLAITPAIIYFIVLSYEQLSPVASGPFDDILRSGLKNNKEVSIINFDSELERSHLVPSTNNNAEFISFKVINLLANRNKSFELNESAIIACNSVQSLITFNKLVNLTNIFFKSFKFYVHFKSASTDELSVLTEIDTMKRNRPANEYDKYMTDILQFQYFIFEENDAIKLMTFEWYTAKKCNEAQLIEVNSFFKTTQTWENANFVIDKFKDFNGCPVIFGAFWGYPSFAFVYHEHGILYYGQNFMMLLGLANVLNYRLKINPYYREYGEKDVPVDFLVHLESMNHFVTFRGNSFFSTPYSFLNDYVAVPVGEDYNGYEKLLLPFDFETWMWILASFVAAYFTAFALKFASTKLRDFVFGENVLTPMMNIAAIFFGISQIVMPGKNFSRYLTMLFILYCMIIRTAYQGKMFEFLQQNMTKPGIQSIEELADKNITLYVEPRGIDFLRFSDDLKGINMEATEQGGTISLLPQLFNSSFKGAIHLRGQGLYYNTRETQGKILDRLLEERLYLEISGLVFPKNHKFYETFNRKTQQLFVAGLFNFYNKEWTELLNKKRYEVYSEPGEVLTMEHLEASFVIWLVSTGFAVAAFVFEWLVRFRDYIVFRCVLECVLKKVQ